jgi:uncharacterized protein (DUF427 family)
MTKSQTTVTRVPAAAERTRLKDGVHIELSPRRVRAYFDNQLLVDSEKVLLVFETKRPPVYWFPIEDVRMDLLTPKDSTADASSGTRRWRSNTGGRVEDNLAWDYPEPAAELAPLAGHIAFYWTPSTAGSRKTRRSTFTRAILTRESTPSTALVTSGLRSTAR